MQPDELLPQQESQHKTGRNGADLSHAEEEGGGEEDAKVEEVVEEEAEEGASDEEAPCGGRVGVDGFSVKEM